MQIDVEADEVGVFGVQKLRRRIGSESAEAVRVDGFGLLDQFIDEFRGAAHAAPAHNVGGNFVHDAVGGHGGMAFAGTRGRAHGGPRFLPGMRRVQKAKMFRPRNIHQELEGMLRRQVQQPRGRHVINPRQVGSEFADLGEIPRRLLARRERFALFVRRERTVGHAFEIEFPVA